MDAPQFEKRHHFRGKSRPGRVMPVRFHPDVDPAWITAETRNVGIGGAFIVSKAPQPIGTRLVVELALPTSDEVFTLAAIVRWTDRRGGMGVQFIDVDVNILLELNDYFSSLVGT